MSVMKLQPRATPADSGVLAELAAETTMVARFIALLKTEQRALKEGFVDALEQLAQEKLALVTDLRGRQARREREAATADGDGIKAWLARKGGAAAARGWLELLEHAREAHRLNYVNGILIETLMRNNRQALNLLQGAAQRATLYGPDGRTQSYSGGRALGIV